MARSSDGGFGVGRVVVNHDSYSWSYIRGILEEVRSVAIAGASEDSTRPSMAVLRYLVEKDYEVCPVNPSAASSGRRICGLEAYGSLSEIPSRVDMVDIFRRSEAAGGVVDEALERDDVRVIWMQLGVRDDAAALRAEKRGLRVVMNRCPKIEYAKLSGEWGWIGGSSGM